MRLGYFSMPLHPAGRTWSETLREDREAVILADRLGFHDAFIGEHLTDRHENITNSLVFLATLISDTTPDQAGHRHHQPVPAAPGAGRRQLGDVRPPGRRALHPRDQPRRAAVGRRGRWASSTRTATRCSPRRSTSSRRSGRASRRTALSCRGTGAPCRPRRDVERRDGRGHVAQAAAAAAPEIVGTVVAPFSKGVIAMGAARLPSAVGELPAPAVGCDALAELRAG